MSSAVQSRLPTHRGGQPALSRLIGIPSDEFAEQHWGRQPLVSSADCLPAGFEDLFGPEAVDELVAERGLRTPFLRVAKDGSTLPERAFTAPGGVGAGIGDQVSDDKLLRLFGDGATIVLQALHRTWAPLRAFSGALASELGHPVQVNAYVTPPQNTGFGDHYDVHDVFVVQVAGRKRWRIRPPVLDSPLRSQPWDNRRDEVRAAAEFPPLLETTLHPGDCLYLPRGYVHAATALGEVSIHLTLGVHVWTAYHLAEQLTTAALSALAKNVDARRSLPLRAGDADVRAGAAQARAAVHAALDEVADEAIVEAFATAARAAQRPEPVRPLAQLVTAETAADVRVVRLRQQLAASISDRDGYAVLICRAGPMRLSLPEVAPIAALLEAGFAEVDELGIDLTTRLLRHGVVLAD